ncbi:CopD family protein [Halobacillus shinanisalinarum]|uniref:CopD family protein n=1 Tax=Halobacillus shinanisalinarum TaxID=2932258 RepID=A0ABY4GVQ2_9BACI|nr:CopD family protein [Halobacillus shinanisalinarum]UOQ92056.1 CopD family protein [Halobacillus shinanisalinarum]
MVFITETLVYLSFSLLMGTMLGYSILAERMPSFHVPKRWLLLSTVGVGLLSLGPALAIIINFTEEMSIWSAGQLVLLKFQVGQVGLLIFLVSSLLFCIIYFYDLAKDRLQAFLGLVLVLLLVVGQGAVSHAFGLQGYWGLTVHTLHFLGVIVWIGLLFIFGWFTNENADWQSILKWFTPIAVICVIVLIAAGYFTMDIVIKNDQETTTIFTQYGNSWLTDYGQALLIKHLLTVPLLLYALMNGFIYRYHLSKDPSHRLQPWIKTESVLALLVFAVTAFMGQQTPHTRGQTYLKRKVLPGCFRLCTEKRLPPKWLST